MREALTKSVNIVSIKLLRELGIENSHAHIQKFGFKKSRLPNDLSLALGSGNFSPAEMVRGYRVIANNGFIYDMHYIDSIRDRFGNFIYSYEELTSQNKTIDAFEEDHDQWSLTLRAILTESLHTSIVLGQKENVLQSFDGQRFSIRNITSARTITDEVIVRIGGMFFGRAEVDELNEKFSKN